MNFYIDMDGVVADWLKRAKSVLQKDWIEGERIPTHEWNKIKDDDRFYRELELLPGALDLVNYIRLYHHNNAGSTVQFLTALPHDYSMPYAAMDKVFWAHKYFPGIPVFLGPFSHDKWRYCKGPTDILIDDRTSNISEWRREGGQAHLYKNWADCKAWLEEIL